MNVQNILLAIGSAIAGGLVVALLMHSAGPTVTAKSDRLSGSTAETAFLPERFGVPTTTQ
jgi:hypothetical protein